jgi:hypothetical protein
VLEILCLLQQLQGKTASLISSGFDLERFNKLMARYTSARQLTSSRELGLTRRTTGFTFTSSIPAGMLLAEFLAVDAIARLTEDGLLGRLQECQCGLWYYAKFAHQRFCSTECRVNFWESSDERKAQKRKRARENYAYHKVHGRK